MSGLLVIPLAMRLDTPAGEFDGVLVTALDPGRLVHVFRAIRVGDRSTVGIIDREGKLYVWSQSTDLVPASPSAAEARHSATMVAGDRGRSMREVIDEDSVVGLAAIRGTDLVAFAALPTERVLADQRRDSRIICGFALLTLVGLTLPIVLVARWAEGEAARRGPSSTWTASSS